MNQDTTFIYKYSVKENKKVQEIRNKYLPREESKLEELKRLDYMVQRSGIIESLCFGIGAAVGIADPMIPGIVIGVVGMMMAIINYPIYKGILDSRRKKYADKIIALSDKIISK